MFAEALRNEGYSTYRARLHALLGISAAATGKQTHDCIANGFPVQRLMGQFLSAMLYMLRLWDKLVQKVEQVRLT
ncbi:hypothetical protein [Castellaniella sp. MT123]|uniref:hypothetical protein n=1 Tax=Castellaniella sp. MT123 TaxID=3140381 RepID=UPI0031F35B42